MADDDVKKSKKKKKARKDKWGQPIPSHDSIEQLEAEEESLGASHQSDRDQQHEEEEEEKERSCDGGNDGYEPNKIVVSGMPYSTTEDEIRELFKDIGPLHQLQLSRFPDSGNFRGLAFVTFQVINRITFIHVSGSKLVSIIESRQPTQMDAYLLLGRWF